MARLIFFNATKSPYRLKASFTNTAGLFDTDHLLFFRFRLNFNNYKRFAEEMSTSAHIRQKLIQIKFH